MLFPKDPVEGQNTIVSGSLYIYTDGIWKQVNPPVQKTFSNPIPPPEPCGPLRQPTIKIKRSFNSDEPPHLEEGELAYSFKSKKLFIGDKQGKVHVLLET